MLFDADNPLALGDGNPLPAVALLLPSAVAPPVTPVTFRLVFDNKLGLSVHANLAIILFCPCLIVVYAGVSVKLHLE